MNENDEQLPAWLRSARSDVEKTKRHWESILSEGDADISRGLEIGKVARQQLRGLNYLEQTLSQNVRPNMWNDEVVGATGPHLAGTLSTYEQTGNRMAHLYEVFGQRKQEEHEYFLNVVSNTAFSAGSAIYMGAEIERRFEVTIPDYKPVLETVKPDQLGSRQQILDELRVLLRPFDPKYLHMLEGSEAALQMESQDHLSQAAHSMRDLFQQLIEDLAPADAVKQQPWFEPTPGAPGGVSRMSRLRYISYGSGETFDEDEIKQLDEAAEGAKIALDLSIARAHDHDPQLKKPQVELAIDHARFSLLEVLKRYKARREWE